MKINSKNKSILVFSDPHQGIERLEYILEKENYDIAICLGDWFDSFIYDSNYHVEKTCDFLKKWMVKDNFFTCIGNHDIHYLYNNNTTICSGYTRAKHDLISHHLENFPSPIRDKFKWYIWIDDFLCSHAGINAHYFNPSVEITKDGITKWLDTHIEFANNSLISGGYHWLYSAGHSRGGRLKFGGITWQDFDCEFDPIDGLKQLVGHTPHKSILNHASDGNINFTDSNDLDIDCHLNQYLIIRDEKLTIHSYRDL